MALRRILNGGLGRRNAVANEQGPSRRRDDCWRQGLANAVTSGELEIVGEPIVDVETGRLVGCDAVAKVPVLGRAGDAGSWDRPRSGTSPSRLQATRAMLAYADDDLVVDVNRLLVEGVRSLTTVQGLDLPDGIFISVTVDGRFVASDCFLETIKEAVRLAGLTADQLLLSINAEPGFEASWSKLQRLKSHGSQVAVHDYSLGSESSESLRRYPIDVVRLALATQEREGSVADDDDQLLGGALKMAHDFDCLTIVDNVRTLDELDRVRAAGFDAAHGCARGPERP